MARGSSAQNISPRKNIRNSRVRIPIRYFRVLICLAIAALASFFPGEARASELDISPDAREAIDLMYKGKTEEALALAHKI